MPVARRAAALAFAATLALSSVAMAQHQATGYAQSSRPEIGPQIGYGTDHTKFFIGAQFAYPIVNRLDIYPSFRYFFPGNDLTLWALAAEVRYWPKLNIRNSGLYVGGGLDLAHTSFDSNIPGVGNASNTDLGLGLLGGWQFATSSNLLPFAQIRVVVGDANRVEFGGGINFRL